MAEYEEWHWEFLGFEASKNRPVQEWFDSLPEDASDEAKDTLGYLQKQPNHLWRRPKFDRLQEEEISEVRFWTGSNEYRIYGVFGGVLGRKRTFIFLHGTDKKTANDRKGKRVANDRLKQLKQGQATVHEFEFEKESDSSA